MNSRKNSFSEGLHKVAAPAWFYEMNRTMQAGKNLKNISRVGLKNTVDGKKLPK